MDSRNEAQVYLKGSAIYKLFNNKETGQKSAAVENSVLEFLQTKSFPAPKPKGLFEYNNRFGVEMDYVPGPSLQEDFYTPGHGKRVGEIMGNLHYRLHSISRDKLPNNLPQAIDLFEGIGFSNVIDSLHQTKLVLTHGDFHPANIIDSPQGEIVIDWSRAFIGPAEADIATTLVLFLIFEIPQSEDEEENAIIHENLFEAQRAYLKEYDSQLRLERSLIESWMLVIAEYFSNRSGKILDIDIGSINVLWP